MVHHDGGPDRHIEESARRERGRSSTDDSLGDLIGDVVEDVLKP